LKRQTGKLGLSRLLTASWAIGLGWLVMLGTPSAANAVEWNPAPPAEYRVVPGDTLWSIAGRFLRRPWEWRDVWRGNPDIENPDLIYPGDRIVLDHRGDQSFLRLDQGGGGSERLSPRIRVTPLINPVPVIPLQAIVPFLTRPQVIETEALDSMPYVVDLAEEHVIGGPGDRVYVRSIHAAQPVDYTILRPGQPYKDPDTAAILGHEAAFIADATLEITGDPATLAIQRSEKEVRIGDCVMPARRFDLGSGFFPHAARRGLRGHILSVLDGVSQIGQFSVVAIDRGRNDGVQTGDVFEIWQKGEAVRDTIKPEFGEKLVGNEVRAGVLMVFLPYRRVSFALVMNAERFIHVLDSVRAP
jgi:hypothetical protein